MQADPGPYARYCTLEGRNEVPETLDAQMLDDAAALFARGEKMQLQYNIRNTHRAIGTKLSSRITRQYGMNGLQPGHLTVRLRGSAGQSLGAFGVQGLKLEVFGDANDYVGKGLSGATIVVRPAPSSTLVSHEQHHHRQHRAVRRHRRLPVSRRARPASVSPCAIPAPPPWSKAAARTAANT